MAGTVINLNDNTPAAVVGRTNVQWAADNQNPRNVSASILTPAVANLSDATITSPTTGQAIVYSGTKWVNGSATLATLTTAGDLLYENSTPANARLPIGTTGQCLTVVSGLPAWVGFGQAVLTTAGDLVYENATPAAARLGIGTSKQVLEVISGLPAWRNGADATLTTAGDTLYENSTPALARLPIGTSKQVLEVISGLPAWTSGADATLTTAGDLLYENSTPALARLPIGTLGQVLTVQGSGLPGWQAAGGGSGTSLIRKRCVIYIQGTAAPASNGNDIASGTNVFGSTNPDVANSRQTSYQYHSTGSGGANWAGLNGQLSPGAIAWQFLTNVYFYNSFWTDATTNRRIWLGIFQTSLSQSTIFGSDTLATGEYIAFRYSTVAGDTVWQCVVCDGATQNVVSSGVAPDTKSHAFNIVSTDGTSIKFYIDGALVATVTSNIPATRNLAYYLAGVTNAVGASSAYYNFTSITVESDT